MAEELHERDKDTKRMHGAAAAELDRALKASAAAAAELARAQAATADLASREAALTQAKQSMTTDVQRGFQVGGAGRRPGPHPTQHRSLTA